MFTTNTELLTFTYKVAEAKSGNFAIREKMWCLISIMLFPTLLLKILNAIYVQIGCWSKNQEFCGNVAIAVFSENYFVYFNITVLEISGRPVVRDD